MCCGKLRYDAVKLADDAGTLLSQTLTNSFGQVVQQLQANTSGSGLITHSEYNARGLLVKQFQSSGEEQMAPRCLNMTASATTPARPSRWQRPPPANSPITEMAYGVETTDEGVFACTTQTRYNATGGLLVSVQKQLISQLSPTLAEKVIAVDERGLTSADWVVYNNGTKRTRYSSAPTSGITTTLPLAIRKDGTWYAYGWDLTKNICEVFGPAGYIRTAYSYSPYGSVTATGDVTQPIQWSSEFNDAELALVYYNYRHYNPVDGRWMIVNFIFSEYDRDLYAYVTNSTIHKFDILGLKKENV